MFIDELPELAEGLSDHVLQLLNSNIINIQKGKLYLSGTLLHTLNVTLSRGLHKTDVEPPEK